MTVCRHAAGMLALALEDPFGAPDPHLDDCPDCSDAVRSVRSLDRALSVAVPRLVSEALPPAHRLGIDRRAADHARRGGLRLRSSAWLLSVVTASALLVGVLVRVAPAMSGPAGASPAGLGSPAVVAPGQSAAPTGSTAPAATRDLPSPGATPAPSTAGPATCAQVFAVAAKAWSGSGMAPVTITGADVGAGTDKLLVTLPGSALRKAFAVCSAGDLRAANGRFTVTYSVKGQGGTARVVSGPVLGSFDRAVLVLCRSSQLSATRACVTLALASPPAASSP